MRERLGQPGGGAVVRITAEEHQRHPRAPGGPYEAGQQRGIGVLGPLPGLRGTGVQLDRQPGRDGAPQQVPQEDGVAHGVPFGAAGQPPSGGSPYVARSGRFGRLGQDGGIPRARPAREGDGPGGGVVDGLGQVGEEGGDGPGGIGHLLGQRLQPDGLERLGVTGAGQFLGGGEVAGRTRVDQVGADPRAPQQQPPGLGDAEFAPPGEVADGRTVGFEPEQRRAPAAYGEAGLGVEEGGARGGRACRADQLGLEGAEAELGAEHSLAVLVHQGRRFDHPGIPLRT